QTTRGPQIIMSRADERYLMKLFEMEVPEIYDGIVEIKAAAREPGQRAKIAVISKDAAVDPVGACVGMKGSRVQNIVQELRGEKIDIVNWDEDPARFVCNALAPAEISKVYMYENQMEMEIVVPDHQLSLAIGRKGQNVRLAAKLTGWKLDIMSEANAAQRTAEAIFNLMLVPGMTQTMAQNIFQSGFGSFQALAEANVEDVMRIPGYDGDEKAQKLVDDAKALLQQYVDEGKEIPKAPVKGGQDSASEATGDAKSQAAQRLKEEMAQLEKAESGEAEAEAAAAAPEAEAASEIEAAAPEAATPEVVAEESGQDEPPVEG
ncbi:MAG: transcription termination/antitermination protein NusA, partial [Bdellovibrionales bacterium]|nr:transcription termination/antitermination protein NusA [Bdellovibrionales bacterium]